MFTMLRLHFDRIGRQSRLSRGRYALRVLRGLLLWAVALLHCMGTAAQSSFDGSEPLAYCDAQVHRALDLLEGQDFQLIPRNILATDTAPGWQCRRASAEEWCSGFWPGILWMDYLETGDTLVRRAAEGYTEALSFLADQPVYDHDLGFLLWCSYGQGYAATGNEAYRQLLLRAADTLATLFNPLVGTILSWPREREPNQWPHNTIIDNMMNLELLFWAAENGGSPYLYDLCVAHAKTTMQHQFLPDGTVQHVAIYDTLTGDFLSATTHQGHAPTSMWARGQAWAIYGYTMVYRFTGLRVFLQFAQKVADRYLERLSERGDGEMVPPWDFDAPDTEVKDASAAAIVASALLELQAYVDVPDGDTYHQAAVEMLRQLSTADYQSRERHVAFLLHSTGHHPAGSEIDAAITYADYYYIEALRRLRHDVYNRLHKNN